MATRTRSVLAGSTIIGLLILSGGNAPLHSTVPPGSFSGKAALTVRKAAARAPVAPRLTADECSTLALKATIAKARAEMRALLPGRPGDPADVGSAMASDRRLSEGIKRTFGNSDLIMSQYSKRGECVVTLKLPLDRLQRLARDL